MHINKNYFKKMKEMRESITAEWAKKTAEDVLGQKIHDQFDRCLNTIESAVKENKMTCNVSIYAEKLVIEGLNNRGFTVKQYSDQRDGSYLSISW